VAPPRKPQEGRSSYKTRNWEKNAKGFQVFEGPWGKIFTYSEEGAFFVTSRVDRLQEGGENPIFSDPGLPFGTALGPDGGPGAAV